MWSGAMLCEAYIEALLVDEDAADQVFEAWDEGEIDDFPTFLAWWWIANSRGCSSTNPRTERLSPAAVHSSAAPGE